MTRPYSVLNMHLFVTREYVCVCWVGIWPRNHCFDNVNSKVCIGFKKKNIFFCVGMVSLRVVFMLTGNKSMLKPVCQVKTNYYSLWSVTACSAK